MTYDHSNDKGEHDKILDRLIELYDDKSKTFQRIFTLLLVFTIIFLFLIFIPYMSILEENRQLSHNLFNISNRLVEIEDKIQNATEKLEEMKLKLSQIHYLNSTIFKQIKDSRAGDAGEGIVRNMDNGKPLSSPTIQNKTYDNSLFHKCNNFVNNNTINCIVEQLEGETIKNSYGPLLIREDLINRLNQRINESSLVGYSTDMEMLVLSTLHRLERSLRGESAILGQRMELQGRDSSYGFWQKSKDQLLQEKSLLQSKQDLLQNETDKVAKILDQIQFPFAKIPLRLDDAIMVFPISLAVGFVLCIHVLCDIVRLRKRFYDILFNKINQKIKWTHKDILIMIPLWIDPFDSKLNQLVRFTILIIPFVIFLLTLYLIINYLMLNIINLNITIYHNPTYDWVYYVLYSLSLILCIYSCWKIIKELHHKPEHISPS